MPRVTCRCGEKLKVPADGPDRLDCPRCGAHIRVRPPGEPAQGPGAGPPADAGAIVSDGFIRFPCPCGRRLKVRAADGVDAGKCPDCGRIVPVPGNTSTLPDPQGAPRPPSSPARGTSNSRTDELDAADLARLERWSSKFKPLPDDARSTGPVTSPHLAATAGGALPPSNVKFEAGLRLCPRCGKPVHLGASTCRECGAAVPR